MMFKAVWTRVAIFAVPLLAAACAQGPSATASVPAVADAGGADSRDEGSDAMGDASPPSAAPCLVPENLGRGLEWVRSNPMFISGLVPGMPAPPPSAVNDYFDDFNANAVHLWESGLPHRMSAWAAANRPDFRFVSWVKRDGTSHDVAEVIGGYPANAPGRIGYQVGDEPRTWSEFFEMEAGVEAVRSVDPDALVYMNFSHQADDLDDFLEHYGTVTKGDIVSFDSYSLGHSMMWKLEKFRKAGLEHGVPYWAYLIAYSENSDFPEETDLRWHTFVHAVYGFTGYSWFLYQVGEPHDSVLRPAFFASSNDWNAARTALYDPAATINKELANLGRVLTQLKSTDVRYIPAIGLLAPDDTEEWTPGAGGDPYIVDIEPVDELTDLAVGFFVDDCNERYVMIQNQNHEGGSYPTDSASSLTLSVDFDFTAAAASGIDETVVLVYDHKSGGELEKSLIVDSDHRARLEIEIAAGDIVLFKYASGRGFATQAP